MNNILEILDKMQFFGGQRAGRELWQSKPSGSGMRRYAFDAEGVFTETSIVMPNR